MTKVSRVIERVWHTHPSPTDSLFDGGNVEMELIVFTDEVRCYKCPKCDCEIVLTKSEIVVDKEEKVEV